MTGTIPTITLSYVEMLLIVLIVLIIYLIVRERNVESFIESTEALYKEGTLGIVEFILNMQTSSGKAYHKSYYTLDPISAKLVQIDYNRFNYLKQAITSDQDYSKPLFTRLFAVKKAPNNVMKNETIQGPIIIENVTMSSSEYVTMIKNLIRKNLEDAIFTALNEKKITVMSYTINMELKGNNYIDDNQGNKNTWVDAAKPINEQEKTSISSVPIIGKAETIGERKNEGIAGEIAELVSSKNGRKNEGIAVKIAEPVNEKIANAKNVADELVSAKKETFFGLNQIASNNFGNKGKRKLLAINMTDYLKQAIKEMDDFR